MGADKEQVQAGLYYSRKDLGCHVEQVPPHEEGPDALVVARLVQLGGGTAQLVSHDDIPDFFQGGYNEDEIEGGGGGFGGGYGGGGGGGGGGDVRWVLGVGAGTDLTPVDMRKYVEGSIAAVDNARHPFHRVISEVVAVRWVLDSASMFKVQPFVYDVLDSTGEGGGGVGGNKSPTRATFDYRIRSLENG